MLLAIDIGNTNINLGVFRSESLLKRYIIPTREKRYHLYLKKILAQNKISDTIICSVVPNATLRLRKDLKRLLKKKPYVIGQDILVPVKNLYRKPKQVGQDRLVNAYAGIKFYGAPLAIVDLGTAITFDIVSKRKEYLGGMILPGLEISLEALSQKTALLPAVKLSPAQEFIGKDTKNSMLSGVVYGFAALTDSLAKKIRTRLGRNTLIIGTGGNIKLIIQHSKEINKIDPDLTLKGLNLIWKNTLL